LRDFKNKLFIFSLKSILVLSSVAIQTNQNISTKFFIPTSIGKII